MAPILPDELVVWEILVRLPAKVLLRCRAVCRSWRDLTSAADFLLAHHRRQPSLPLVEFYGRRDAAVDAFDLWGTAGAERHPILRFDGYNHRHEFKIQASCDGLLVLSHSMNQFCICNPATRQWISPPNLKWCDVLGLYRQGSSGEYRILYHNLMQEPDDNTFCYVLTAGSSMAPRVIEKCEATGTRHVLTNDQSVLLDGRLHWAHFKDRSGVLVFDTVGESFIWVNAPRDCDWDRLKLFEIDGTLGLSGMHYSGTIMEVWVLQDYETEAWLMKYQIQFPVLEMRSIANNSSLDGMILSDNGDVLVDSHSNPHMFHLDSTGKLLQKFQWDSVVSWPTGHWFKESLVQHAFFEKVDGRRMRTPPFFRGI